MRYTTKRYPTVKQKNNNRKIVISVSSFIGINCKRMIATNISVINSAEICLKPLIRDYMLADIAFSCNVIETKTKKNVTFEKDPRNSPHFSQLN